jgi:hypothetical protein
MQPAFQNAAKSRLILLKTVEDLVGGIPEDLTDSPQKWADKETIFSIKPRQKLLVSTRTREPESREMRISVANLETNEVLIQMEGRFVQEKGVDYVLFSYIGLNHQNVIDHQGSAMALLERIKQALDEEKPIPTTISHRTTFTLVEPENA